MNPSSYMYMPFYEHPLKTFFTNTNSVKQKTMSILSKGGFLGRRRNSPPHHEPTWNPINPSYQTQQQYHHTGLDPLGVIRTHQQHQHQNQQYSPPLPSMPFPTDPSSQILNIHIEWKETTEAHVYTAHLPGYKRNEVRVEVDDDRVLSIVCGKSVEKEEQRRGWHCVQLSGGYFVQRLSLPDNSIVDHVKAHMDNGVLTITVPKHHRGPNHRVRNINISSRA